MANRLDALQRDLRDLQQYVYGGKGAPAASEGQAAAGAAGDARKLYADLDYRIALLEEQFRVMTGQNEEIDHRLQELQVRLDKLVADVDMRLRNLEQGGALSGGAPAQAAPAGGGETAAAVEPAQSGPATGYMPSGEPKSLGTVPAEAPAEGPSGAPAVQSEAVMLPEGPPSEQYAYALDQVKAMQRVAGTPDANAATHRAEAALNQFIEANPNDPLAENASYWLGEVYYFARDYDMAVVTFARNFQNDPEGHKAPENLLKLGMSYVNLGQKTEACAAFAKLLQSFPNAAAGVLQRTKQEARSAGCS